MNMTIDFSIAFADYGFSDTYLAMMAAGVSTEMGGTLNGLVCTASQSEEICCSDSQSQTVTITSGGSITIVSTEDGDTDTSSGRI